MHLSTFQKFKLHISGIFHGDLRLDNVLVALRMVQADGHDLALSDTLVLKKRWTIWFLLLRLQTFTIL